MDINYIHNKMLECTKLAETNRELVKARRAQWVEQQKKLHPKRTDEENKANGEILAKTDPILRAGIADNQWYIQQATMWAAVLSAEIDYLSYLDKEQLRILLQNEEEWPG